MKIKIIGEVIYLNGRREVLYEDTKKVIKFIVLKKDDVLEEKIKEKNDKNRKDSGS
jgi:hypothetical protein